ncbi:hypothetical protein H0W91_02125 [Patescibacteria group bacterium]|nr:hypothetical protein [Patescibacteria group bacterium]
MTINIGDTVTFSTNRDVSFWPASDPHPSHSIYSEFDSKEPISPKNTWSFTFEKSGIWHFHDHTNPYFNGTINVLDKNGVVQYKCDTNNKEKCWDDYLSLAVNTGGPKGGLDALSYLMKNDPSFVDQGCHAYAHRVGEKSLEYYLSSKKDISQWDFPIESTYCGYGFLHGVFEHYFRIKPSFVSEICSELDKKFSSEIPRIRLNCFHGAGHGFIQDPPEESLWGNVQGIISPALEKCSKVSPGNNNDEITECNEGVFNIIAGWMMSGSYSISKFDENDPFELCRNQTSWPYQKACYYELSLKVNFFGHDNIPELAKRYANKIADNEIAGMVLHSIVASVVQDTVDKNDFTDYLLQCRELQERLHKDCLAAIVGGLMAHGVPQQEYVKPLKLCSSEKMNMTEKEYCFSQLGAVIKKTYDKGKVSEICLLYPDSYKKYCQL